MTKRLRPLLAAIAVVALAVPALANAAPELTIGGKKATKGQTLTKTSTNSTIQTSLGKIVCTSIASHVVVNENTGTTIHTVDDTLSPGTAGVGCTVGGKAVTVGSTTVTTEHINAAGAGTSIWHKTAKIGEVNCSFSTAGGAFTYTSGTNKLKFTNVDLVATPAACEPGTFNGEFTVTSTAGAVVYH